MTVSRHVARANHGAICGMTEQLDVYDPAIGPPSRHNHAFVALLLSIPVASFSFAVLLLVGLTIWETLLFSWLIQLLSLSLTLAFSLLRAGLLRPEAVKV